MKKLLLLAILPIIFSCNGNEKKETSNESTAKVEKNKDPYALELENFDFTTEISAQLPPRTIYKPDTIFYSIKNGNQEKPVKIAYAQQDFSTENYFANFDDFYFNAINYTTTPGGKMMLMSAFVENAESEEVQNFIKTLDKKYGKSIRTKSAMTMIDIYTWTLDDRIIRYCLEPENDENNIRIDPDENGDLKQGEKQPHTRATIYIINKKYKDELIGDLVYVDEE